MSNVSNTEDENLVTMDKETYEYLLSQAKQEKPQKAQPKQETEETQETSTNNVNFPTAVRPTFMDQVKQNAIDLAASTIPILAIQGVILGVKFMGSRGLRKAEEEPFILRGNMQDPYSMNRY